MPSDWAGVLTDQEKHRGEVCMASIMGHNLKHAKKNITVCVCMPCTLDRNPETCQQIIIHALWQEQANGASNPGRSEGKCGWVSANTFLHVLGVPSGMCEHARFCARASVPFPSNVRWPVDRGRGCKQILKNIRGCNRNKQIWGVIRYSWHNGP